MINKSYTYNLLIFFIVIIVQLFWPDIPIRKDGEIIFRFQADIILLYITILAIRYGRLTAVIMGFGGGLLQDLALGEALGIFSLSKSISGYCLGSIFNYRTIWAINIQYSVVFLSYLFHFFIYFYLAHGFNLPNIPVYILLTSSTVFILLIVLNKLIYKNRLFVN